MEILRKRFSGSGSASLLRSGRDGALQADGDHPRLSPGVTLQEVSFFSVALNREMTYRVFLPANLAPGQKLPIVYLLHGQGDDYRSWSNRTAVSRYAEPSLHGGLILVMPEGDSSYFMNAVKKPGDKYEDYFVQDLISDVEARFPAEGGRAQRAVVGISMGGFAAVKFALSRPELFAFAGAFSPAIDVTRRQFAFGGVAQWWRFRTIFGPWGSKSRDSSDPFLLVETADPAATPYLYLSAGEQEGLFGPNIQFATRLGERGFRHEFHRTPGGHNWGEWNAQIPDCFDSLFQHLNPGG